VLLDVALSSVERASLAWLAGFETSTVENLAVVITRARQPRWAQVALVVPPHRGAPPRGRSLPAASVGIPVRRESLMGAGDAHTIGARLRLIRRARDKSLRVVAGLAGISKSTLSQIERGERAWTAWPKSSRWPTRYRSPQAN
jgi:DNA-binding XRE family transcriptional regulator